MDSNLNSLHCAALVGLCFSSFANGQQASPADMNREGPRTEVRVTYLGNAGWQIDNGPTTILVDPYLSQFRTKRGANPNTDDDADEIVAPDAAQIDARVQHADYILITHGHVDHMLDAPYISNKRGATIIGRETVANLARAYGVPEARLITVLGGEDYDFGGFSLRVIPSLHSPLWKKHYYDTRWSGAAPAGLKAPLHESAFVEGGSLAYLLRIAGHSILIMGSMNFIEREMNGLRPDIALVGAGESRKENHDYVGRLMRALGNPAIVFPTHWDSYGSKSEKQARENVEEFSVEIRAASRKTKVIIPEYFKAIALP
jgi:L-ascorbate metabolism protein UlaG (beta-lactamase superfamily)